MIISIARAMADEPLVLVEVTNPELGDRLARMGIYTGSELMRLQEEVVPGPVRIEGPKGDVVLPGGMAAKVIIHHDDGHKTPVMEMQPGESGHVEGLVGCGTLAASLEVLGIRENDRIRMVRRVPPMDYLVLAGQRRVQLAESMAAKIWGEMNGRQMQLVMAGRDKEFSVKMVLGGERAKNRLHDLGIFPGRGITLQSVSPAQSAGSMGRDRIVVRTEDGLRLFLRQDQAGNIRVVSLR